MTFPTVAHQLKRIRYEAFKQRNRERVVLIRANGKALGLCVE